MKRVTMQDLENLCLIINKTAGTSQSYCDKVGETPFKTNVGHYHIDSAYGGYRLDQTVNDAGGITVIIPGYITKRELFEKMHVFLSGLRMRAK
jgi:hypothetical protein